MEVLTFDRIAADVEKVLAICSDAGVRTAGTRIAVAAKRIREIWEHIATHRPDEDWPRVGGFRDVSLLIEGSEFATLLPCIERWLAEQPEDVSSKLNRVLSGPLLPTQETAETNKARNVLFELTLAAKLERFGRRTEHGEHPDVTLRLPQRDIFLECKRTFSPKKVDENMKDAEAQLASDLEEAPGTTFGVVAIDVTKVVNPEYECCKFWDESQLGRNMASRVDSVIARTKSTRERFRAQRIIGVLYRFVTIAHDLLHNRYVLAIQDCVVSLGGPQYTNRYAAFEAFRRSLGMDGVRYRRNTKALLG
ncbi:MAG TPA: hypothetical protein VIS07_09340 [Candidatus Binatia bacterium]